MESATTMDKLRVLLPHWIEHNRQHEAEFMNWAASARTDGAERLAVFLDEAAAHMAAADGILQKARSEAGGSPGGGHAPPAHRHAHPHAR